MNKTAIKDKIDSRIYDRIQTEVSIDKFVPSLTYNRFDLAFKLLYLEGYSSKKASDYITIYEDHIRAFSLGTYTEPGQEDEKNSVEKYKKIFENLYSDIKINGFNNEKGIIPVALDGSILNGAHRTSISILLKKEIEVVKTELVPSEYGYDFFYKRNVPSIVLDKVATKFIEFSDNTYVAFVWPTAKGYNIDLDTLFPNIVYRKELKLNANGAHNLLSQIYKGELWLGSIEDNFKGVINKLVECFKTYEPVRVVVFQEKSLDKVIELKEKIRSVFGMGKHSIHITDTHEEAICVSKFVFNANGVHFLNHAKPNKYKNLHEKINKFKQFLEINEESALDYVLDYESTFELYGLNEVDNINYLSCSSKDNLVSSQGITNDSELSYYKQGLIDLIYDSDNFFYFENVKFVSFFNVYEFKKKRSKGSDINDLLVMDALFENNKWSLQVNSIKHRLIYKKIVFRSQLIYLIKKIGMYEILQIIYKYLK